VRIEDDDVFDVTSYTAEVPIGSEIEVISGKDVKITESPP